MSENLDLVRSIHADWERGDLRRVDWARIDIEFVRDIELDPDRTEGIAGMASAWRRWLDEWEDFRPVEVEEYRELDDGRVLVAGRIRGRGRASGVEVEKKVREPVRASRRPRREARPLRRPRPRLRRPRLGGVGDVAGERGGR